MSHVLFLRRWIAANAAGEAAGLGGTALTAALCMSTVLRGESVVAQLLGALVLILAGALVEGGIVGAAQWAALRTRLPDLSRRDWVWATIHGAGVAWALGMMPSTVMSLLASPTAGSTSAPPPEIEGALKYLLAALMGLVLGPILAAFQWRVLRRHLRNALWWLPANALAWALGMPVIFIATDLITAATRWYIIPWIVLAALVTAGAVVGVVHGIALLRLLPGNVEHGESFT